MDCKHFGECGSCRIYEGGYEAQLSQKAESIKTLFSDMYDGDIIPHTSPESHYRARSEFKVWHMGDDVHYAMNAREHKGVVLIEECPKVIEPIAALMWPLLERIKADKIDHKLFGIDFLSTTDGEIAISML